MAGPGPGNREPGRHRLVPGERLVSSLPGTGIPRTVEPPFADRTDAGLRLGAELAARTWHHPVVLGLARGGLPVAAPVAAALRAPLDVAVARKIGAPGRPEFGLGAVPADGPPFLDHAGISACGLTPDELSSAVEQARAEARDTVRRYLGGGPPASVAGQDVLLVDDGVATGGTAIAALRALRDRAPARVVFAAPVGAPEAVRLLDAEADEVVCLRQPARFQAVGTWYADFGQTTDAEVFALLGR
ncbi:phosphoribosyltransferase [Amycolatopsis jiangsuensis]|uniref:Putative phosphoribosyltransferase n=1 Tax=Amycolatopsis jiangsuensis TaxID=1181879 RepID=A0A840ISN7_9PSEU|nr:phosphoribosyltransferase family protein [Amycolatopsis jiangsuensis]MBB4684158.1 putative phosphoribosyltransferase [Amycolatopsis jiangsuensis]